MALRLHRLHLFTDLGSDESILGVETSSGARSVLAGQHSELQRSRFSIIFSFPIVRALYSSSAPRISLGLSCGVELHRGRVTLTD